MMEKPDYFEIHKIYDPLFKASGIDELSDIDWIMCEITGKKRSELPFCGKFSSEQFQKIEKALKARLNHKPLGYIFGYWEFYGRAFKVSNKVLIPRLDTEILIDCAIKQINLKSKANGGSVKILDIGTGSGAIAITLEKETGAKVTASDISPEALQIAQENAKNLNSEICFVQSDLFKSLDGEKFDIIVSNPPYIESKVIDTLQMEVKNQEPHLALDGGEDGLDFYRKIIREAPKHLNQNGEIIFEIGFNQAKSVSKLLKEEFINIQIIKDFGGNDRVVYAKLGGK